MTKYAAHPTLYKGIMFRSRLEAKWAAYFDNRCWAWTYEPFDLRGYSPDFIIDGVDPDKYTLVEVKPATKLAQLAAPIARILQAGWKGPWLVVGADPDVCMEGIGRHAQGRRYLGREAPIAWAQACNTTQWIPNKDHGMCPKCHKPMLFLHHMVCKPAR